MITGVTFIFFGGFSITQVFMRSEWPSFVRQLLVMISVVPVLIVLHELIHSFGFLFLGIRKFYFGGSIKKFYFYVATDESLSGLQYIFVALMPFLVFTTVFLFILFTHNQWVFCISGLLFFHTTFCAGDFGVSNYVVLNGIKSASIQSSRKEGVTRFSFIKKEKPSQL